MQRRAGQLFILTAVSLATAQARADPCIAPLPRAGERFGGQVRYVGDGDSLCVGRSADPRTWIEVRVSDHYAPELSEPGGSRAKSMLERLALGRPLLCIAGRRSYDRVVAACKLNGRALGPLLRSAGSPAGGRGLRGRYAP